jgi:hypothetical protein
MTDLEILQAQKLNADMLHKIAQALREMKTE